MTVGRVGGVRTNTLGPISNDANWEPGLAGKIGGAWRTGAGRQGLKAVRNLARRKGRRCRSSVRMRLHLAGAGSGCDGLLRRLRFGGLCGRLTRLRRLRAELLGEPLDTALGVDQLLAPGEER